jgi:hypothetical protein
VSQTSTPTDDAATASEGATALTERQNSPDRAATGTSEVGTADRQALHMALSPKPPLHALSSSVAIAKTDTEGVLGAAYRPIENLLAQSQSSLCVFQHSDTTREANPAANPDHVDGVTGLINRLIGMLSLGALHPNDASSVQAVAQVTVAPVTAAPINQPAAAGYGTVPLQMKSVTEPVINISVNGGPSVPVLVDTGSDGLVVGIQDIGLQNLGFPTGFGISGYSGGLDYLYVTFKTTVNFGNGIVTAPAPVDVVLLTFPVSLSAFLAPDGADGVLGIGPNSLGPGPNSVTASLPGDLGDGVLINESAGVLQFGPNPLTTRVSVSGAPYANLEVQIGNGPLEPVKVTLDSGGVYGTIPSSVIGNSQLSGNLPAGTVVSVYTGDGQTLLYSYTTTATNTPTITSGNVMNTGYVPFAQQPVYIANSTSGIGTTSLVYV